MPSKTKKATEPAQSSQEGGDVSMTNMPPSIPEEQLPFLEEQRIRIVNLPTRKSTEYTKLILSAQLPGSSETAASFEFLNEDHTLGNALRYIIMKNPDVEFCGYSIPHPSEPKMNVRIQTYEGTTAFNALEKGLDDLMDLCDVVAEKFAEARQEFMNEEAAAS